jgi:hypothetical protein
VDRDQRRRWSLLDPMLPPDSYFAAVQLAGFAPWQIGLALLAGAHLSSSGS